MAFADVPGSMSRWFPGGGLGWYWFGRYSPKRPGLMEERVMIANELVGKYLARLGMYVLTLPAWVAWVGFYLCFFVLGVMVDAARLGLRDGPDMMAWVFDEKRSA